MYGRPGRHVHAAATEASLGAIGVQTIHLRAAPACRRDYGKVSTKFATCTRVRKPIRKPIKTIVSSITMYNMK